MINGFNRSGELQRQEVQPLNWSSLNLLNPLQRLLNNREGLERRGGSERGSPHWAPPFFLKFW
jgi:hypothetical protein